MQTNTAVVTSMTTALLGNYFYFYEAWYNFPLKILINRHLALVTMDDMQYWLKLGFISHYYS
jgi:hypothetical protein